jgi:hypothetical protein
MMMTATTIMMMMMMMMMSWSIFLHQGRQNKQWPFLTCVLEVPGSSLGGTETILFEICWLL